MDLVLAPDDRRMLEQLLRQTTLSQAIAKRVRVVLALADGRPLLHHRRAVRLHGSIHCDLEAALHRRRGPGAGRCARRGAGPPAQSGPGSRSPIATRGSGAEEQTMRAALASRRKLAFG
jgi:hypothetical protein